jgi:predicted 3-demethylubiquinone-9 3-methyltransferase (glyoxalase superfamily)
MQKITPFLWFDGQAEQAAKYYVSVFENSKIVSVSPGPGGAAMSVEFELDGQLFYALNGGPDYKFTPAISLFVSCENQQEVDMYWEKLSAGGKTQPCGWLQDRWGLSWQIIPSILGKLLSDKDRAKAQRAMQAMLKMSKIDIQGLEQAARG